MTSRHASALSGRPYRRSHGASSNSNTNLKTNDNINSNSSSRGEVPSELASGTFVFCLPRSEARKQWIAREGRSGKGLGFRKPTQTESGTSRLHHSEGIPGPQSI